MSIKTEDIVKGAVVITSMPKNSLKDGDHIMVGVGPLSFGTALTITQGPTQLYPEDGAKYVRLETFGGQYLEIRLSDLKPRVTLADHD